MKTKALKALIIVVCLFICSVYQAESHEYYTISSNDNNQHESIIGLININENIQFHTETYLSIIFKSTDTNCYGFIDKESNSFHPAMYYHIYDLFCRDAIYPILVEIEPGNYKYVDRKTGNAILDGQFRLFGEESEFRNGYALICFDSEISSFPSLIDINGIIVSFPEGIIPIGSVQDNGLLIVLKIDEYGDAFYGICNTFGEIIVAPQFDYIAEYNNGYACVRIGDNWGLIDEHGMITMNGL